MRARIPLPTPIPLGLAVSLVVLLATGTACDRSRDELGGQATRATHARDKVEEHVADERWNSPDASTARETPPEPLEPLPDTPFELGKIKTLAQAPEATLERQEWAFEGVRGVSYRVRVPRKAARLRVLASDEIVPLKDLVEGEQGDPPPETFVAINGGFYDLDGRAMGLVLRDSKQIRPVTKNGGSGVVQQRGDDVSVVHRRDWKPGAEHALQSIDRIVADGASLMTEGRRERHAARSAVAVGEDHVWFVVAIEKGSIAGTPAGHAFQLQSTSVRGLPLWAFARYLIATTDTVDALNLDGAVSTQMIAQVGDTSLDIRGERGTVNALYMRFR